MSCALEKQKKESNCPVLNYTGTHTNKVVFFYSAEFEFLAWVSMKVTKDLLVFSGRCALDTRDQLSCGGLHRNSSQKLYLWLSCTGSTQRGGFKYKQYNRSNIYLCSPCANVSSSPRQTPSPPKSKIILFIMHNLHLYFLWVNLSKV